MDFAALPPEINSANLYTGPGSGPLLAAAATWDRLAKGWYPAASACSSVISELTSGPWRGPSSSAMAAAAASYAAWLTTTAGQVLDTAEQARAAALAYQSAFAMTVPPPVIAANRALPVTLIATNVLGQNTAAIAATEAHYAEMWAQDAAAMYGYAATPAAAATLTPFTAPPPTTNPAGLAGQGAVGHAAANAGDTQAALSQLTTIIPNTLQSLAAPASSPSPLSSLIRSTRSCRRRVHWAGSPARPFQRQPNQIAPAGHQPGRSSVARTAAPAGSDRPPTRRGQRPRQAYSAGPIEPTPTPSTGGHRPTRHHRAGVGATQLGRPSTNDSSGASGMPAGMFAAPLMTPSTGRDEPTSAGKPAWFTTRPKVPRSPAGG